jgi:hypothetical protein
MRLHTEYRPSLKIHRTFIGRNESGEQIEERGLASAIGTENAHDLAPTNLQIDITHGMKTTETLVDLFDIEKVV